MSPIARFLAIGRRLSQSTYRLSRLDKLVEAIEPKIPPSLRNVLLLGSAGLMVVAVAVFALLGTVGGSQITRSQGPSDEETGLSPLGSEESPKGGESGSLSPPRSSASPTSSRRRGAISASAEDPPITDSTIKIGFIAFTGFEDVNESILGDRNCYDCGDNHLQIKAVVDYVNDQGGVGGREVVPVVHTIDVRRNDAFDVWAQEACATFTEDNKVWAVIDLWGSGIYERQLLACLAKHDTRRIGYTEQDQKTMNDFAPYAYSPGWINMTRNMSAMANGLVKQGFFESGAGALGKARIGLVRFDTPSDERAAAQGLKRSFAAHGLEVIEEVAISYFSRLSDIGVVAAQAGNAVLRFQTNDITHVLIQDRAQLTNYFTQHAESQGYRPRYGLNSHSALRKLQGRNPDEQLRRALVVGWDPTGDTLPQDAFPPNSNRRICMEVLKKTGPQPDEKGISYCDGMLFLKMVADEATELTTAGFPTAVEKLGTRFAPPITHAARFGPGRYDGASHWAPVAFHDDCRCFRYVGSIQPI